MQKVADGPTDFNTQDSTNRGFYIAQGEFGRSHSSGSGVFELRGVKPAAGFPYPTVIFHPRERS